MKLVCTAVLIASLTAPVFGQDAPPADAPIAPVAPEPAPQAPPPDPEQVKKAEALLEEVSKAYKSAKALTDTLAMKIATPMGEQSQDMSITIGSGEDAILSFTGMSIIAVDGKLHFLRDDVPDKFFAAPLEGGLGATLESMFGAGFPLPPQFVLRSDAPADKKLASMTLGMMEIATITGHKENKAEDGTLTHEVTFGSTDGKGSFHVSDKTKLVQKVEMELTPEGAPPGLVITAILNFSPKTYDTLPTPIAFVAGDRKPVDTLEQLEPTPIKVGDASPDFSLPTLDGQTVSLSAMRGSVVVIDFWATWCGPCRRALPLLQEFSTWAESSGQPIKVYAVNVIERFKDNDERKTKVQEFWTKAEYKMPTLLDLDNTVFPKYGFSGIPATVVIGPDGKVVAVHEGFSPDMVDALKKEATDALKVSG